MIFLKVTIDNVGDSYLRHCVEFLGYFFVANSTCISLFVLTPTSLVNPTQKTHFGD